MSYRHARGAFALFVVVSSAACGSVAIPGPATATPAAAAGTPAPPIALSAASDWTAAPTNGSPGVDAPKLSGNELLDNTDFSGGKYIPWTTSYTAPGNGYVKDGQFCIAVSNKGVNSWDARREGQPYGRARQPVRIPARAMRSDAGKPC